MYASRPNAASRIRSAIASATRSIIEPLEGRTLMAGDASIIQSLPFALDFDGTRPGTLADMHGEGTGFTWAQTNKLGNEHQPALLDLRPLEGLLYITTTGTSVLSPS